MNGLFFLWFLIRSPYFHICLAPCGGKMCQNGGSLNTATCTCTCVPPYNGATCAKGKAVDDFTTLI